MRFERVAALALSLVLPAGLAQAANVQTITDNTLIYGYNLVANTPNNGYAWVDVIGTSVFDTNRIVVTRDGADVTFQLFTNYLMPNAPGSNGFPTADLAIDLDNNGTYERGIVLVSHDTFAAGNLYDNATWQTSLQASAPNGSGFIVGGRYCTGGGCPADPAASPEPLVRISSADFVGGYSVSQIANNVDASSTYITSILLSGVNAGGAWNGAFNVLWGTAICANDTIQGGVSAVPLPASLPLFLSALSGLAFIPRKTLRA